MNVLKKLLSKHQYHIYQLAEGLSLKESLYGMNTNHFLYFQIVPILCLCILCNIVSGLGNS